MLRLIISSLLAAIVTLLSACSGEQDMPPPKPVIMTEDNVFKGQADVIQKAQGVEATIQGNFDQQREIIDSQ